MKLLVTTQIVDRNDSDLGFFHTWLEKLAGQVEHLYVICLKKGEYDLPPNVTVLSLGKEEHVTRNTYHVSILKKIQYVRRFYFYIWKYRKEYNHVFVHMNPEYVMLGGLFWRLRQKKVLLWYVHKSVNLRLRIAELFATKIFTASKESFRLPSRKVEVVGHGISIEEFVPQNYHPIFPDTLSLLWVGRITPTKDLETVLKAISELKKKPGMPQIRFSIVGEPVTIIDEEYKKTLAELVRGLQVDCAFVGGRSHRDMPGVYGQHDIFIHTSRTGSVDKVVLEALASGLPVVTSSEAFAGLGDLVKHFPANDYEELAKTIEKVVHSGILKQPNQKGIEYVRTHHNLDNLIQKIMAYFQA